MRFRRVVAGVGLGLALGATAGFVSGEMRGHKLVETVGQYNAEVDTCGQKLGSVVTRSQTVVTECKKFKSVFPVSGGQLVMGPDSVFYFSAPQYTEQDRDNDINKQAALVAGVLGLVGAAIGGAAGAVEVPPAEASQNEQAEAA